MPKSSVKCLSSLFPKSKTSSATAAVLQASDEASSSSLKSLIGHVAGSGTYSSPPEKLSLDSQRSVSAFLRKDAARSLFGGVAFGLGLKEGTFLICGSSVYLSACVVFRTLNPNILVFCCVFAAF